MKYKEIPVKSYNFDYGTGNFVSNHNFALKHAISAWNGKS